MGSLPAQSSVWALAERQHGVVSRAQLLERGLTPQAIKHRLSRGRLHAIHRGVYAVGRPELTRHGIFMAAVLRCNPCAVLSYLSAAELLGIAPFRRSTLDLTVPSRRAPRAQGITVPRRNLDGTELAVRNGIPTTSAVRTLIDVATQLSRSDLETAIALADKLNLASPERLRDELHHRRGAAGVGVLRRLLDGQTFRVTDSELERLFLRTAEAAGLSIPLTGQRLNGFKVDFFWPDLGLVVETDGLRYHRTATQQARDRRRDQTHTASGLTALRFTHAQVRFQREYVRETLAAVAARLATDRLRD